MDRYFSCAEEPRLVMTMGHWAPTTKPAILALQVTVSSGEVKIVLIGDSFVDDNSPYSQAFWALRAMGLPDVSKEGFVLENSEEQQKQISPYCTIDSNRGLVTGVWWWNHGNGHMDLVCTFDDNVGLREGDEIRLLVGIREEN